MDRKPLSLRCDPEQYSTLLWPPAMCNHSCIRQELACYRIGISSKASSSASRSGTTLSHSFADSKSRTAAFCAALPLPQPLAPNSKQDMEGCKKTNRESPGAQSAWGVRTGRHIPCAESFSPARVAGRRHITPKRTDIWMYAMCISTTPSLLPNRNMVYIGHLYLYIHVYFKYRHI